MQQPASASHRAAAEAEQGLCQWEHFEGGLAAAPLCERPQRVEAGQQERL